MELLNWVLIGVDFSPDSRLALEAADYEAAKWGSGLLIVHARAGRSPEDARRPCEEEGVLESWGRYVKKTPRKKVSFLSTEGDPAAKIIDIAKEFAVRKIYMGRGGTADAPGPVAAAVRAALPERVELVSRLASQICREAA